jgi:hypothetical protein
MTAMLAAEADFGKRETELNMVMHRFEPGIGDICVDPTGLQVRIEDIDIYDYVHFSVVGARLIKKDRFQALDRKGDEATSGQMSCVAFLHRFTKVCHGTADRKAA